MSMANPATMASAVFYNPAALNCPKAIPRTHPTGRPFGLGNRKNELFNQALESKGVEVFAGSVAWLHQLRQAEIKTAVVSSSKHCQAIIKVAGIADLFDARVDGNVAEELNLKGKPAPDTYLKAAEMVGVPPLTSRGG